MQPRGCEQWGAPGLPFNMPWIGILRPLPFASAASGHSVTVPACSFLSLERWGTFTFGCGKEGSLQDGSSRHSVRGHGLSAFLGPSLLVFIREVVTFAAPDHSGFPLASIERLLRFCLPLHPAPFHAQSHIQCRAFYFG